MNMVQDDIENHSELEFDGDEPQEPGTKPPRRTRVKCAWCPKRFTEPLDRHRHEKAGHATEFTAREKQEEREQAAEHAREQAEKEAEELTKKIGGLDFANLTEQTKAFIQALDGAGLLETGKGLGLAMPKRKALISKFDDESDRLPENKQALENLLSDYGLSAS